jgi:hypothetical protein
LSAHCRTHGEISAAVFRDLIGASRKFAIALLDWCDRTGVTTRCGRHATIAGDERWTARTTRIRLAAVSSAPSV